MGYEPQRDEFSPARSDTAAAPNGADEDEGIAGFSPSRGSRPWLDTWAPPGPGKREEAASTRRAIQQDQQADGGDSQSAGPFGEQLAACISIRSAPAGEPASCQDVLFFLGVQ